MLRNASVLLAIALLVSCNKGESASSRIDSVSASADSPAPREAQNSYSALAGDTLDLVSIGGRGLPQPSGVRLPCDSARTPLRQRIVASVDSTYWQLTVVRPGCRDTTNSRSDTLETRGQYRILGDTLDLYGSDGGDHEFFGMLFPDSVVQVGTGAGNVWRYSRRSGAAGDPAEMGHLKTDSLLLARDIDGSGKTDYVVLQSRIAPVGHLRSYRVAVYLDTDPGTRRPDWAMAWDDLNEGSQTLGGSFPIAPGVSLLDISWGASDYTGDELLVAERGKVRRELSHGIDYGNGYLTITPNGGTVEVEATLPHLELRGAPVTSDIKCPESRLAAMKLVFDFKTGRFTPGRAFCAKPR